SARARECDAADRGDVLHGMEDWIPRFAGARRLPYAGRREADIKSTRLPDGAGHRGDASAQKRAAAAPRERGVETRVDWGGRGLCAGDRGRRGKRDEGEGQS